MRTEEQISKIRSRVSDPYKVDNFITQDDIDQLLKIWDDHEGDKVYKPTSPVTLDLYPYLEDDVLKKILLKIEKEIGPFAIDSAFFYDVDYPHIIHMDDSFKYSDVYKGITLPLSIEGPQIDVLPKMCFFDQFYFHGPAKFFRDEEHMPTYYNTQIYDYKNVDGKIGGKFSIGHRLKYMTHLKPRWLDGLSLHSVLDWEPTSAIIFDSTRIHCGSDFRSLGIKRKMGISIFTKVL
jgi:hypothetical protein